LKAKGEVWEVIPGFNGKYFVSNYGNVTRKKRYPGNNIIWESRKWQYQKVLMVIQYSDYGESWVQLTFPDGRRTSRRINWLVAEAFKYASRDDKIIYRDGNPYNCRLDNLRLSSEYHSTRLNKKQIDYCWEQHFEHKVTYLKLAERFMVSMWTINAALVKEKKRRRYEEKSDSRGNCCTSDREST
jgi:hypothetical protein